MKTIYKTISLTLFLPFFTFAQDGFVPVQPIPAIDASTTDSYLASLFTIFIVVAVLLAVIRLMICGIQYMTSESISSKGAAKTCIQYVLGGLLLALTSFVILQTVNQDLVGGSFDSISGTINVGDVSDINADVTIDGDQLNVDDDDDPENRFIYEIRNLCPGGNVSQHGAEGESRCEFLLEKDLEAPIWTPVSSCRENAAGNYEYTIRNIGFGCGGGTETRQFPPTAGWTNVFDRDDDCENALQIRLDERNFGGVGPAVGGECTDTGLPAMGGPPPGP